MIANIKELNRNLFKLMNENDIVFVCPHIGPDCDAIASAVALNLIIKKLGTKSYIIIDDAKSKIETAVKTIINDLPDDVCIINASSALDIAKNNNVLLATVDTNKKELIPFKDYSCFTDIMVIDHHSEGKTSLSTEYSYINPNVSSTCEIIYSLIRETGLKLEDISSDEFNLANCLLSGISLDTAKFTKNMGPNTMKVVAKLMEKGANMNYVNDLFIDNFENDMRIQQLVSKTIWNIYTIGIALDEENPDTIYSKEDLAKAADILLKYKGVSLAFALGYISDKVAYISGRSKGDINVGEIMSSFGGGGNIQNGAACIETDDIKVLKKTLMDRVKPGYYIK